MKTVVGYAYAVPLHDVLRNLVAQAGVPPRTNGPPEFIQGTRYGTFGKEWSTPAELQRKVLEVHGPTPSCFLRKVDEWQVIEKEVVQDWYEDLLHDAEEQHRTEGIRMYYSFVDTSDLYQAPSVEGDAYFFLKAKRLKHKAEDTQGIAVTTIDKRSLQLTASQKETLYRALLRYGEGKIKPLQFVMVSVVPDDD